MKRADKIVIKAKDFEEATRYRFPRDANYVLFVVKDGDFYFQVRREDDSVIWTSEKRKVIVGDDCVYKLRVIDVLYIGLTIDNDNTVLGGTDYVAFVFHNNLFTEVFTMHDSIVFDYANKIN